jgi:hypothetical protein
VVERLCDKGVLSGALDSTKIRFVTHLGIDQHQIDQALARTASVLREL